MENLHYLFAAYAAIWLLLFAYITRLQRRTRELEEELRQLRAELGEGSGDPAAS